MNTESPDDLSRLLDAYRDATHYGTLPHATHRFEHFNPACGDRMMFELCVDNSRIVGAAFSGGVCAVGTASASVLCQLAEQHNTDWLSRLRESDFLALLPYRVPRQRIRCATQPLQAAQGALVHPL